MNLSMLAPGDAVVDIECGGFHTCFRTAQRRLYCVGSDDEGEVAAGRRVDRSACDAGARRSSGKARADFRARRRSSLAR